MLLTTNKQNSADRAQGLRYFAYFRTLATMRSTQIIISIILLTCSVCYSQGDTLNYVDEDSLKQGHWIFYGVDLPHKNYPDSNKVSEGYYLNDKRHGEWTLYEKDSSIKHRGEFKFGRPIGKFVRGRDLYGTDCETLKEDEFDSIAVRLNHSLSYDTEYDTLLFFSGIDQSKIVYLDSLTQLDEKQRTEVSLLCTHSLNIFIYKFHKGSPCVVRFSDCEKQSNSARIAIECARKLFDYN